jgi:hypothetical protein
MNLKFLIPILTTIPALTFAGVIGGTATVVVDDGSEPFIEGYHEATIIIESTGDVAHMWTYDQVETQILGGQVSHYNGHGNSNVDVFGGDISWLNLREESTASIFGAQDISWLVLDAGAEATIYGSDFSYSGGHVSGIWGDGTAFSFWALLESDLSTGAISDFKPDSLHLLPVVVSEPATAFMLLTGLLALVRLRRSHKA